MAVSSENLINMKIKSDGGKSLGQNEKKKGHTELLKASEIKFQRLFDTSQDGNILVDAETGKITDVNAFFLLLFSSPRAEVIGKSVWDYAPIKDIVPSKAAFLEMISKKYLRYEKIPLTLNDEKTIYIDFASHYFEVRKKKIVHCNLRDITERVLAEKKVVFISNHDTLTNLFNRSFFDEEIHRLENSRHYPISIFMIDVDNLKAINDKHGHIEGDIILKRAAQVLKSSFRDEDIIARIGGDEFAVVLANTGPLAADSILNRVYTKLKQHNESHPGLALNMSVGKASAMTQSSLIQLLKDADDQMYLQKKLKIGQMLENSAEESNSRKR